MRRRLFVLFLIGLLAISARSADAQRCRPFPLRADILVDRVCPKAIYSLAFSPLGTMLAVGLEDGNVLLWDLAAPPAVPCLDPPLTLPGRWGPVWSLAFSPRNDRLAAVSGDDGVDLWSLTNRTKEGVVRLSGYRGRIRSLAFSPGGEMLATGGGVFVTVGEVRLWNIDALPKGIPEAEQPSTFVDFEGHRQVVASVAFSPDGRLLASGGGRFLCPAEINLWDVSARGHVALLGPPPPDQVLAVAFSHDSRTLAVAARDGVISLWDVATGRQKCWWLAHTREAFFLAFSPGGRVLVSAGGDATVKFWDPATGCRLACLTDCCWQRSAGEPFSVALSPDGRLLATGSVCGRLQIWEVGLAGE